MQNLGYFRCRDLEVATGGVLQEKVFLEISQNLQKTYVLESFFKIKLQAWGLQLY